MDANAAKQDVEALVSSQWLNSILASNPTSIRVLDVTTTYRPDEPSSPWSSKPHIPGSTHFDLTECRDQTSSCHITLPSPDEFSKYVGEKLGIDNDTYVIIYENDHVFKMAAGPRVWWMFRIFGHDKVSILDGGLQQWIADGYPISTETTDAVLATTFKVDFRSHLIKSYDDVLQNQKTGEFTLIDARKPQWFDGSQPSMMLGVKNGYINKSVNVPFANFLQEGSTKVKSPDEIRREFEDGGIDLSRPLATHCLIGTGACTTAFGAFLVGKKDVAVYDGSWEEFVKRGPDDAVTTVPDRSAPTPH